MTRPERDFAQSAPVDASPSGRLGEVLGLLDELAEIIRESDALLRGIEQVTGLRVGEVHVLLAVAHGTDRLGPIAQRIGQPGRAARATVEGLIDRGLLAWRHEDTVEGGAPADLVRLSEAGAAALEQTQGVQIRLLDTMVGQLGGHGVAAFRTTLRAVGEVLQLVGSRATVHENPHRVHGQETHGDSGAGTLAPIGNRLEP
ncbi:MAG TPA: hypothetical protein VFZ37_14810 [Jiangellaceae bacterium]